MWEGVEVLWSNPLSDPVMVQWLWVCSASWVVNIVLSGCSVSTVPGRHSPRRRLCIHRRLSLSESWWGPEPGLGAVVLFTDAGVGGVFMFYRLPCPVTPHCCFQESAPAAVFFLFFATECHCCSVVLDPLSPPFVCTEVERRKLTGSESEAAAGQIIALSPTAVAHPHRLVFAPLPPPAPETR